MTTPNAAYLSAISLMLAAYGFFYNLYRDRIEAGLDAGDPKAKNAIEDEIKVVKEACSAALLLGIVPLIAWLVFLPPVIEEIEAAVNTIRDSDSLGDALGEYSAIDTAFCIVASAWILIAVGVLDKARRLRSTLGKLRAKLAKLQRGASPASADVVAEPE